VFEHRIMEQLDRMVASGRITEDEAGRLRAAERSAAFEEVVTGIRARHAQVHTDAAVAEGRMSQSEADGFVDRMRSGEHAKELRSQITGTH
jgi:polyhydroxyalkanoate synthesis regulator phasin